MEDNKRIKITNESIIADIADSISKLNFFCEFDTKREDKIQIQKELFYLINYQKEFVIKHLKLCSTLYQKAQFYILKYNLSFLDDIAKTIEHLGKIHGNILRINRILVTHLHKTEKEKLEKESLYTTEG